VKVSSTDQYFVAADGVLALRANVQRAKWSWGMTMPQATQEDYDTAAVKISYSVVPDDDLSRRLEEGDGRYHYFSGQPENDSLNYDRTLLGNRRLRLRAEGVARGEPHLLANSAYARFVTHRFMNLHSAGYILTDIASLSLLRRGYSPVHCSGFRVGKATVLVLAAPNTGKTLTAMTACMQHEAEFIAEDLAITDGKTLYSVPWTSTFRYYDQIDRSLRSRVLAAATAKFPPIELVNMGRSDRVDSLMAPTRLLSASEVTHLVILERGPRDVRSIAIEDAHRRAVNLNRYEFNYVKAPLLVAYEYFNPELDLDAASAEERRILRDVATNVSERVIVRAEDPNDYAPLILDHLRKS
jgi:hypothetical protein